MANNRMFLVHAPTCLCVQIAARLTAPWSLRVDVAVAIKSLFDRVMTSVTCDDDDPKHDHQKIVTEDDARFVFRQAEPKRVCRIVQRAPARRMP